MLKKILRNNKDLPGSVIGGALLIAGSCIGAGMLALPVLTGLLGFLPSLLLLVLSWVFMTSTSLLLLEASGWFYQRINIISIVEKSLGRWGKALAWFLYLFLFYSLMVAYIAGAFHLFVGNIYVMIFLGIIIFLGTSFVDFINRTLMIPLLIGYFGMIFLGLSKIRLDYLMHSNFKYFFLPISVFITSFGFHNIIPSLVSYMKGDLKRTKRSILLGSLMVFIIYFFWELVILGILPKEGEKSFYESYLAGKETTELLFHYLKSSWARIFAGFFGYFSILTSLLAQGLGLMHFLADGFRWDLTKKNRLLLIIIILIPSLLLAFLYPSIFYSALSFAGGFCAIILFGIIPVIMIWKGRYKKKITTSFHLPGGKPVLMIIFFISLAVLLCEIFLTHV